MPTYRKGLHPADHGGVVTFEQARIPHRLFFSDRPQSPTDRPAYFLHANTATRLAGIWLSASPSERALLIALGTKPTTRHACAPFTARCEALLLRDGGEVALLQPVTAADPSRWIVGATVVVGDISATADVLRRGGVPAIEPHAYGHSALWVSPPHAHGLWLEFRQDG